MKLRLTIFLGDVFEDVGIKAKLHDPSAWLLHRDNLHHLEQLSQDSTNTVYTSLGDLPKDLATTYNILKQADVIFYTPPLTIWSDKKTLDIKDPTDSIHGLTEVLLLLLPKTVKVIGLDPFTPAQIDPIKLVDTRKTSDKQMWSVGCSITHGIGVEAHERYGSLLAEQLKLPCSYLSRSGSSIGWAADQILRSDLRSGDLVVWGITGWPRITHVHEHQLLKGVTIACYKTHPEYQKIVSMDTLWSDQTFYHQFYSIQQVINCCKKNNVTLLLVGLLNSNYSLLGYLKSQTNFVQIHYNLEYKDSRLSETYIDIGTDNQHPGSKQHLEYKNTILNFIQEHKLNI
jgi:hypothetical protein